MRHVFFPEAKALRGTGQTWTKGCAVRLAAREQWQFDVH